MSGHVSSNVGTPTYVSTTGTICITSGACELYGFIIKGTATGTVQIFGGTTISPLLSGALGYTTLGGSTANPVPLYFPFPVSLPTGFTIRHLSSDPNLTLFWRATPNPT